MDFNQLESFISVVKHCSFSSAAKELFITQPTVSNNIQNLEKTLQTTLLDRTSKTITLTDAGKILYKYAVELINLRDKAKFTISEHSNNVDGEIEITSSSIPEQYILPYIIKDFLNIHPDVRFSVTHRNSKLVVDDILEGKLNFGIVGAKYYNDILEYVDFCEDELILAVPNNGSYPWPNDSCLEMDLFLRDKFIFRKKDSGTRRLIEQRLLNKDISIDSLNIVSLIDSNEMIKKMIELGLGISFVSKISVKNETSLDLVKTYKIKNLDLKRSFYFVYNKNRTLSPSVEVFKNYLDEWKNL